MEVLKRADFSPFLKSYDFTMFSKLPNNCFHLGDGMFVMVCLNDKHVEVIFSDHVATAGDELAPTLNEIDLQASTWIRLSDSINNTDFVVLPDFYDSYSVVNNELFLAVVTTDEHKCISLQKCVLHADFSREFVPGVCLLSEYQWNHLKDVSQGISHYVTTFTLKHALPLEIEEHVENLDLLPFDESLDKIECEMFLSTALCENIEKFVNDGIHAVFQCHGCIRQYGNQLGHECITMTREQTLNKYFNLSVTKMDLKLFATTFVTQHLGMAQFLTPEFFESINVIALMKCIREIYLNKVL